MLWYEGWKIAFDGRLLSFILFFFLDFPALDLSLQAVREGQTGSLVNLLLIHVWDVVDRWMPEDMPFNYQIITNGKGNGKNGWRFQQFDRWQWYPPRNHHWQPNHNYFSSYRSSSFFHMVHVATVDSTFIDLGSTCGEHFESIYMSSSDIHIYFLVWL